MPCSGCELMYQAGEAACRRCPLRPKNAKPVEKKVKPSYKLKYVMKEGSID